MDPISRRQFVSSISAAAASFALSSHALGQTAKGPATQSQPASGPSPRRPNVILLYIDDLNFRHVGAYGGKVLTPHIDSLAGDGVIYSRNYAVCAVCTPSRFNVVTGQYATRCHGLLKKTKPGSWPIIGWNQNITDDQTLPKMLKAAGYRTGMVGKWHLNATPLTKLSADADTSDPGVLRIVRENYHKAIASVKNAGFDYASAIYNQNAEGMPLPKEWIVHNQDWITAGALEFIEQNKDRPFYLYFASTIPHSPFGLKASLESDPRATTAGLLDKPLNVQPSREDVLRRTRAAGVTDKEAYMTWLDDGIGTVLKKLDQLGLSDDTLILFMSDNANIAKFTCYDGGARTPFIARWPGHIKPGGKSDALVGNIDLVPTILEVCSVRPPEKRGSGRPEHPADPDRPHGSGPRPPPPGGHLHPRHRDRRPLEVRGRAVSPGSPGQDRLRPDQAAQPGRQRRPVAL